MTTEDTEGTEAATPERDEAREDARLLSERLTRLELDSAFELAKLERERDKAREDATNFYAKIGELERERDEAWKKLHKVLKLLDDYDEAIKNPSSPFLAAFKKWFTWEAGK